jgi:myo-inositol 2-dehydrogenase/D-chiro-inositol 1-dehydrogenase
MRMGVIGVGRIGRYHARVLGQHPDVERLVIADSDPERARQVAGDLGALVADSVDDLLDRVDAVAIAASTAAHAELITKAVDAGRPTFCEKPIALDLDSTAAVVRHVRAANVPVQMGFQRRFDHGYRGARELVQSGALGAVYIVRLAGHDPAPPHESYIPQSGGMFRDLHVHDFDIIPWVLGQHITEVYADGAVLCDPMFARHGDVDTTVGVLRFSGGTLGILSGSRHDPLGYDIRTELFGSKDSVAVGWDARMPLRSLEPGMPPRPPSAYQNFLDRFDAAYRAELAAFVDVARGRAQTPCTVEDAESALRVAMACDRSRAEHRPVSLAEIG